MVTADQDLTEEQLSVLSKVEKLLRLAGRTSHPEEAASAASKAAELLAAYNLSAAQVSADEDRSVVREERSVRGGTYAYQRELWDAVADLNFCLHWVVPTEVLARHGRGGQRDYWRYEFHHVVVGRQVNTRVAIHMGTYLEGAIERLVAERYPTNSQRRSREAFAFREGAADEIVLRVRERRREAAAAEQRRAAEAARAGVVTTQALTVSSYAQQERDANLDAVFGEGWSARRRAEREERARAAREAEAEYAAWAAANPEEARRDAERAECEHRRRRAQRGRRSARPSAREQRQWTAQYAQGRDAGATVGLDPQTDHGAGSADQITQQRRLT